ncbi:MAG TPA: rRNA maturation RNase YbeY [Sedimentisphaerales bacterium]|nr:rRNA maturation RNase YbeY [Sedimentisphaerales bacterium]HRS10751.1 rRNA maturation RNase YbeY [Sedimentisphaerales bacterium]HRV47456.1 rRNA maturation RNase YbeY [Sedimentisphaerales bacterium]
MNMIQITRQSHDAPADDSRLEALIRAIGERFGLCGATISVAIVDDAQITELNRRFLHHEGTTDCLSFDLSDADVPGSPRVFEVIVNAQRAAREAARRGHSAQAELALYVTHGLLHQLGFDDATAELARVMHRTEDEILQHAGFGMVYNSRSDSP